MAEIYNWQVIQTFVYSHEAHFAKAYLESEGLETEIRDELTVQVNNFNSNAIGGVKLLVKEKDYNRALELLIKGNFINESIKDETKIEIVPVEKGFNKEICPFCKSENISIKKVPNIWTVVVMFLGAVLPIFRKSFKCYDCEKEWKYQMK